MLNSQQRTLDKSMFIRSQNVEVHIYYGEKRWREKNRQKWLTYYRERYQREREWYLAYHRNRIWGTPAKKARGALGAAVRQGRIAPSCCEKCGASKAEAHHEDYSKPFDVAWLCHKCHIALHFQQRLKKEAADKCPKE